MNDLKSSNLSGELSIAKQYGRFRVQTVTSGNTPPTLPDIMVNYTFTKAGCPIEIQGKSIYLRFSKVNEIMTGYCRECLPVYCTLAFFEMLNKQFSPVFAPIFYNEKLESAVSLYKTLYFTLDTGDVKTALAYYLDNPFNFTGSYEMTLIKTKLTALRNSLKDIEERYKARLFNEVLPANATDKDGKPLAPNDIKWFNEKKAGKILSDEAIIFLSKEPIMKYCWTSKSNFQKIR